jgi:hypothetical protein
LPTINNNRSPRRRRPLACNARVCPVCVYVIDSIRFRPTLEIQSINQSIKSQAPCARCGPPFSPPPKVSPHCAFSSSSLAHTHAIIIIISKGVGAHTARVRLCRINARAAANIDSSHLFTRITRPFNQSDAPPPDEQVPAAGAGAAGRDGGRRQGQEGYVGSIQGRTLCGSVVHQQLMDRSTD